jgi:hypothetical protein
MHRTTIAFCLALGLAPACGDDGGSTGTTEATTTDATTTGMGTSTGGSSSGGSSSGIDASSSGGSSGPTTGETSGTDSGSSGADSSSGPATESSSGDSTGGGIVATFTCSETSVVDPPMVETITGSFDEAGVPHDVLATYDQSGNVDFQVDLAVPVAADDPYAEDVAYWEDTLTMIGWDVNPPGDPTGDRKYFFIPDGAQNVAIFSAFYYRVYEFGGNGQFEFDCTLL